MSKREILEKIQKLLALATSENENEALAAMTMAHHLLSKHELFMNEVVQADDIKNYVKTNGTQVEEDMAWEYVQEILREYFFVEIAKTKRKVLTGTFEDLFGEKIAECYAIIGEEAHVKIASHACGIYMRCFMGHFERYKNRAHVVPTVRKYFYLGMFKGLEEQLQSAMARVYEQAGLDPKDMAELKKRTNVNLSEDGAPMPSKQKVLTSEDVKGKDLEALRAGYAVGSKIKIIQPPPISDREKKDRDIRKAKGKKQKKSKSKEASELKETLRIKSKNS